MLLFNILSLLGGICWKFLHLVFQRIFDRLLVLVQIHLYILTEMEIFLLLFSISYASICFMGS